MDAFLAIGLSNALVATLLAVVAFLVSMVVRRPALSHALWLLVLVKLITPPLVPLSVPMGDWESTHDTFSLGTTADEPAQGEGGEAETFWMPPLPSSIGPGLSDLESPKDTATANTASDEASPVPAVPPVDSAVEERPLAADLPPEPLGVFASFPWTRLLGALALLGSCLWFGLVGWRVWQFHRILRFAQPADADTVAHAAGIGAKLGLRTLPPIVMVPGAVSPMLWGILKPCLLLPHDLWADLDWAQRGSLLAHELAHYRRGDHWVRLLETVVTGLFWWHPVVWWARHELRQAEELCCDAWVLWALPAANKPYARALLAAVEFLSTSARPLPVPASGLGHISHLRRRLTMILRRSPPRTVGWAAWPAVLALGLLLPICPLEAQAPPGPEAQKPSATPPGEAVVRAQQPESELRGQMHELLHSIPRFQEITGHPPKRVTVITPEGERHLVLMAAPQPDEPRREPERDKEIEAARAEIQKLREALMRAEQRLAELVRSRLEREFREFRPGQPPPGQPPGGPGPGQPGAPGGPAGGFGFGFGGAVRPFADFERRLSELERKVDRIAEMLEQRFGPRPGPGEPPPGPAIRRAPAGPPGPVPPDRPDRGGRPGRPDAPRPPDAPPRDRERDRPPEERPDREQPPQESPVLNGF